MSSSSQECAREAARAVEARISLGANTSLLVSGQQPHGGGVYLGLIRKTESSSPSLALAAVRKGRGEDRHGYQEVSLEDITRFHQTMEGDCTIRTRRGANFILPRKPHPLTTILTSSMQQTNAEGASNGEWVEHDWMKSLPRMSNTAKGTVSFGFEDQKQVQQGMGDATTEMTTYHRQRRITQPQIYVSDERIVSVTLEALHQARPLARNLDQCRSQLQTLQTELHGFSRRLRDGQDLSTLGASMVEHRRKDAELARVEAVAITVAEQLDLTPEETKILRQLDQHRRSDGGGEALTAFVLARIESLRGLMDRLDRLQKRPTKEGSVKKESIAAAFKTLGESFAIVLNRVVTRGVGRSSQEGVGALSLGPLCQFLRQSAFPIYTTLVHRTMHRLRPLLKSTFEPTLRTLSSFVLHWRKRSLLAIPPKSISPYRFKGVRWWWWWPSSSNAPKLLSPSPFVSDRAPDPSQIRPVTSIAALLELALGTVSTSWVVASRVLGIPPEDSVLPFDELQAAIWVSLSDSFETSNPASHIVQLLDPLRQIVHKEMDGVIAHGLLPLIDKSLAWISTSLGITSKERSSRKPPLVLGGLVHELEALERTVTAAANQFTDSEIAALKANGNTLPKSGLWPPVLELPRTLCALHQQKEQLDRDCSSKRTTSFVRRILTEVLTHLREMERTCANAQKPQQQALGRLYLQYHVFLYGFSAVTSSLTDDMFAGLNDFEIHAARLQDVWVERSHLIQEAPQLLRFAAAAREALQLPGEDERLQHPALQPTRIKAMRPVIRDELKNAPPRIAYRIARDVDSLLRESKRKASDQLAHSLRTSLMSAAERLILDAVRVFNRAAESIHCPTLPITGHLF